MDSDRRHDLEHNALDSELSRMMVFFKTHGNRIFWAVIIIAMVLIVLMYAKNHRLRNQGLEAQRFQEIIQRPAPGAELTVLEQRNFASTMVADLVEFSSSAKDPLLGSQAIIMAGNMSLRMYLDPSSRRNDQLDEAEAIFNQARTDFADQPIVVSQALYGLGIVEENRYDFDAAREHYNTLLGTPGTGGTPAAVLAMQRIESLAGLAEPVVFETTIPMDPSLDPMIPGDDDDWSFPEMDGFESPDGFTGE
jgi:hypothetical protein